MKRIVCACIDELLRFDTREDADMFVRRLEYSHRKYRVEKAEPQEDGTVLIRVKRQYNNAAMFGEEAK